MRCRECKGRRHADCAAGDCTCGCNPARIVATRERAKLIDAQHAAVMAAPRSVRVRGLSEARPRKARARQARPRQARRVASRGPDGWLDGPTLADLAGAALWTLIRWADAGGLPADWATTARGSGKQRWYDPRSLALILVQAELYGITKEGGPNARVTRARVRSAVTDAWTRPGGRYLHVARCGAARWTDTLTLPVDGWLIDTERIDAHAAELLDREPVACET